MRCAFGSDHMVKVGDFWVDRYEAVLVPSSFWSSGACNGAGTPYASAGGASPADDYPSPSFPDNGNWSAPVYSCSVSGQVPSRMMTWFQAEQACLVAGKHLCSNAEWQAAVAGTYDPGNYSGSGSCLTGGSAPRAAGSAGSVPGASGSCISRWGAEDMIGNLWEWVADWQEAGRPWMSSDGQEASAWDSSYGDDFTWNVDGRSSNGTAYTQGLPAAGLRGGDWSDGTDAGAFAVNWANGPSSWDTTYGARCCAGVP